MTDTPWNDPATLTRIRANPAQHDLPREVLKEGSLRDVVRYVAALPSLRGLQIALPERGTAPFSFSSSEIASLLNSVEGEDSTSVGAPSSKMIAEQRGIPYVAADMQRRDMSDGMKA